MAILNKDGADYVGYEYKEKIVPSEKASLYMDSYGCFGWEIDPNSSYQNKNLWKSKKMSLRFRRDRKICNRMELTRLQRNFDGCVLEIERLEQSKTTIAAIAAIIVGLIGTAFMAGSVFAITAQPPDVALCTVLAVPAFIGWIAPFFIYKAVWYKQTERVAELIEVKYDELHEICEKGNRLLI